jgi:ABC-2 type transport system ATP-binding protein
VSVPAIRTRGLTKHYGDVLALDALDLQVEQGEVFGFLGPNGAGKSTTIRLLLGLIRPTAGSAEVLGVPVSDVERAHRHLGYVPGDVALWPQLTGAEVLHLLGNLSGRVDTAYRDELVEQFDLDVSKRSRSYSKGNRQKVALIAALMTRPDVLLLDEPTSGLDPLKMEEFQAVVRDAAARGQTVFLSSHLLDEVQEVCTRVGILRSGRLVEVATLDDLRQRGSTVYEIAVDGPVPALAGVPGVQDVVQLDDVVRVTVTGSPRPLLTELARLPVTSLRTRELELEEVFLGYYGEQQ